MLLKKAERVIKEKGISALKIKVVNRLKYKTASLKYAYTHKLLPIEIAKQRERKYKIPVKISICVPVYNVDKKYFREMLESVLSQTYSNWQLCLADGSTDEFSYIEKMVEDCHDSRIRYKKLISNQGIVGNSNAAVELADGEYIALLDNDDVLTPDALFEIRKAIDTGADFIYTDEASFSKNINSPDIIHFKSDFSIYNLRGNNYICHLSAFRKSLFTSVGGFRLGYDGSQDHDLILRLCENARKIHHIPKVLYNWRVHGGSVASDISIKPYCIVTGVRAVNSHLKRLFIDGSCKSINETTPVYKVTYGKGNNKATLINDISDFDGITSEYIIVASKDIEVKENVISELSRYIQQSDVGVVGAVIVKNYKIQSAGLVIKNGLIHCYKNENILSDGYMHTLNYAHSVSAVGNYVFAIKKSLVDKVGGFDKNLPENEKIIDMCFRLRDKGYDIIIDPYAKAVGKAENINLSNEFKEKWKNKLSEDDKFMRKEIYG